MTDEPQDTAALATSLSESRQLQEPPEWATRRAMAIWRPAPASETQPPLLRRVLAELVQAFGGAPLALGLRSGGEAPRQWLFQAEAHDIELRLRRDPQQPDDRWQLTGQVLGPQALGELLLSPAEPAGEARRVNLDDLGDFQVDDLPAGRWQLSLLLPDRQIDLPLLAWPDEPAA